MKWNLFIDSIIDKHNVCNNCSKLCSLTVTNAWHCRWSNLHTLPKMTANSCTLAVAKDIRASRPLSKSIRVVAVSCTNRWSLFLEFGITLYIYEYIVKNSKLIYKCTTKNNLLNILLKLDRNDTQWKIATFKYHHLFWIKYRKYEICNIIN